MVLSILSEPLTQCDFPPNLPNLVTQSLLCPYLVYNQTLPSFGPTVYLSLCMNSWLPASFPLLQPTPYSYTNNTQQDLTMKLGNSHNNLNSPCCLPPITALQGAPTVLSLPFETRVSSCTTLSLYFLTARPLNPKWSYSFIQILAKHMAKVKAAVARVRAGHRFMFINSSH